MSQSALRSGSELCIPLFSASLSVSHFGCRDLPPPQCSDTSYGALEAAAASAWVFSFGLVFVFVVDRKYIYSTGRSFEPVHSSGRFCTREEEEEALNLHISFKWKFCSRAEDLNIYVCRCICSFKWGVLSTCSEEALKLHIIRATESLLAAT